MEAHLRLHEYYWRGGHLIVHNDSWFAWLPKIYPRDTVYETTQCAHESQIVELLCIDEVVSSYVLMRWWLVREGKGQETYFNIHVTRSTVDWETKFDSNAQESSSACYFPCSKIFFVLVSKNYSFYTGFRKLK